MIPVDDGMDQRGAAMGPGNGCVFRRVEWVEQRHTGFVRKRPGDERGVMW